MVADESTMLGLSTAQEGDVAVRTDVNKTFILRGSGFNHIANWQELLTPTDLVSSVNGKTGTVTIGLSDLGGVDDTSFGTHVASNLHLTAAQRNIIAGADNTRVIASTGADVLATKALFDAAVTAGGLKNISRNRCDCNTECGQVLSWY